MSDMRSNGKRARNLLNAADIFLLVKGKANISFSRIRTVHCTHDRKYLGA
jgi:hypothetical protein